jgi:hypothetical protein
MESTLQEKIECILEERRKNLPDVQAQYGNIQDRKKRISSVVTCIDDLIQYSSKMDEEQVELLSEIKAELLNVLDSYGEIHDKLSNLEARFSRGSINIGVSGEARVGKSTTLQSFSGLSDTQIPTGSGLPVTAVRSEIFNDPDSYADVEFRDTETFINEYIAPHVANVNSTNACNLIIESIAGLRTAALPLSLGENVPSSASKSLRCLKDAQESIDSYSNLLTGQTIREDIDSIRKYVAYPTDEEINTGGLINRAYLAVKSVRIHSPFPSLDGEKIGLIDLPGLGEIGKSVADIHTAGLENEVDQILLIMRPTEAEGYVKEGIAANIDQLRTIQKGISRRSDLIVAAINNDASNQKSAKTLRNDFEAAINSAQESDKIEIRDFEAIDSSSVRGLFSYLLDKLVDALPAMDKDVFDHVMSEGIGQIDLRCDAALSSLSALANKIMKTIPLEDSYLDKLADELSRSLIFEYEELEERKFADAGGTNPLRADLERQVESIYKENDKRINNGLFLSSDKAWHIHAKGRADYVNFLRSDAKRIKAEIADSYQDVDIFYDSAINALKAQVLDVFYENTGRFYELVGVDPACATSDEDIQKLVDELDAVTRDEEFTQCFRFISNVTFKFSQNVFYNIYSSLEELHNPDADQRLGEHGLSGAERISIAEVDLKRMASKGNLEIKNEILKYNDQFNRFLFTCMTFFNDFLYRKDDRRFERNIRALLKECRDYVIPDENVSIDRDVQRSIKRLKDAIVGNEVGISQEKVEAQPEKMAPAKAQKSQVESRFQNDPIENAAAKSVSSPKTKPVIPASTSENENPPQKQGEALKPKSSSKPKQPTQGSLKYTGSYDQEWQ